MSRPTPLPNLLDLAYAAGLTVSSPVWGLRLLRTGKWRSDWAGKMGRVRAMGSDPRPTILIHGVSVGEVAAAAPLVERLGGPSGRGQARVVVSTTTNTGHARAQALYGRDYTVVRYPLDFSRAVHRFLDRVRPDAVALLELEVWPNFTRICRERGIPTVVVNGRLSESSFRGYRRLRALLSPAFQRLAGVGAQTEDYARRFVAMGVPADRIVVTDSMKWDVALDPDTTEAGRRLGREMGVDPHRPLVVAVSTGPDEEALLLRDRPEGVQLMVVPRKPERFEEVARLADWVRRSAGPASRKAGGDRPELFLVDTMGEAEAATALGDVVVVGRSYDGLGGSNPVPPAALGRPMIMGPDHHNFLEMTEALGAGGALQVAPEPWPAIREILGDDDLREKMSRAGPRTIAAHAGATDRNVEVILSQLRDFTLPGRDRNASV